MYTNIFEQTKEIGVVRAIGFRKNQMTRVYVYEAFTLTFSASLMGIVIGTVLAWTMTLQRAIFTQLPIEFVFPGQQIILTILGSIACALVSALFPARILAGKPVASVMRTV